MTFFAFVLVGCGTSWPSRYPWCDTDDITIGDYVLAACNVGASVAGTRSESYGDFYERGVNTPIAKIMDSKYYDDVDEIPVIEGWVFQDWSINPQWPCAKGYHIPSYDEWKWFMFAWHTDNPYGERQNYDSEVLEQSVIEWDLEGLTKFQMDTLLPMTHTTLTYYDYWERKVWVPGSYAWGWPYWLSSLVGWGIVANEGVGWQIFDDISVEDIKLVKLENIIKAGCAVRCFKD